VGRDPATLDITVGINVRYPDLATDAYPVGTEGEALTGSIDEVAAGLAAHAELGATHLIANLEPATPPAVERFAAAMTRFRGTASEVSGATPSATPTVPPIG
jgi:hypothetical protein